VPLVQSSVRRPQEEEKEGKAPAHLPFPPGKRATQKEVESQVDDFVVNGEPEGIGIGLGFAQQKKDRRPERGGPPCYQRLNHLIPEVRRQSSFRSRVGSAKLTAGIFLFKKRRDHDPLRPLPLVPILLLGALIGPTPIQGQLLFDWPIRAVPQPEAVLTGAGALFWNPGGISEAAGGGREIWIAHVDGPDVTGVRGVAGAGTLDLPMGLRGAIGYWHLGIPDIPRTTDSPIQGIGTVEVAEDVLLLGLATDLGSSTGFGGALRLQRGSAAGEIRTRVEGDLGLSMTPHLPLSPRIGMALRGLGQTPSLLAGVEVTLPPLAQARLPLRLGYGFEKERGSGLTEHRFSLRSSWMEQFHAGVGLTRWGREDGWTPLWMLGLELGRYSFSVLREELANNFGPVHFYRASVRLPESRGPSE